MEWSDVILPASVNLLSGDIGTGKTALAFYLLEKLSRKYKLMPVVAMKNVRLVPWGGKVVVTGLKSIPNLPGSIIFIDEAGIQLPLDRTGDREMVTNFLSLPRHRDQILIMAYHFPKLVLSRYIPFFSSFLFKRPPYLYQFAGKRTRDEFSVMMSKADEEFNKLPKEDINRHCYVVSPAKRWSGMMTNGLCSFWSQEISTSWATEL